MLLLFDTNVVLTFLRDSPVKHVIESVYNPFNRENISIVSVVTVGELRAFALKNKWGELRIQRMENFLRKFVVADIRSDDIIDRYAEIDALSQGRLDGRKLIVSARNMGKNDLWIAATASILEAALLTTDNDFDHLHDEFLSLAKIDLING